MSVGGEPLFTSALGLQATNRPATRAQGVDECKWLDEQIRQLDALARQPQSAATQDMIAQKRRAARDRQFRIPCR